MIFWRIKGKIVQTVLCCVLCATVLHSDKQFLKMSVGLGLGAVLWLHHSTTYVDAAYSYRPSSVVCRSVTLVSPTKTAAPVELLFGLRTWVGPGNHVLDGVQIPSWEGANFGGRMGVPL